MKQSELNIAQRIGLECLWWSARAFSVLPYWFKYHVVANILYSFLYYLLRYRMQVVTSNLRNSFPEKSEEELMAIRKGFYKTLAELFVDTVNMTGMNQTKARSLITIPGAEEHRKAVHGRDWIVAAGHFGCWEYCSLWGAFDPSQLTLTVYHPLHNPVMECFFQRLRTSDYSLPVTMKESLLFYLRHKDQGVDGKNLVVGLAADQNPPLRPDSHWFRFLNQDTIFFDGAEKLALRCNMPIYYLTVRRMYPGHYEILFHQLYDGHEQVAPNEITERYVRMLENEIRTYPELWLWSHRRWKRKRPNADN